MHIVTIVSKGNTEIPVGKVRKLEYKLILFICMMIIEDHFRN